MRLSRRSTVLLRLAIGGRPRLHLHPADRDLHLRLQRQQHPRMAAAGADPRLVPEGDRKPLGPRGSAHLAEGGARGDGDRDRARHPRLAGRRPLPLLRSRDDLFPRHPADRPAGDRHRRRDQQHLHPGARGPAQPAHGDRRPRHLLHRRRLQQRRRPPAPGLDLLRGSLGRPRRPHLADLPLRHPAQPEAPPWPPAACSPSPSPSTRSSSPRSRSAPAKKPCRSGSSPASSVPTNCRSSTRSPCSSC